MNEEIIKKLMEGFAKFLIVRQSDDIDKKLRDFYLCMTNQSEDKGISDEIVDFLDIIYKNPTRWETFAMYIEREFPINKYNSVLDVGCGPWAELSFLLAKKGYNVVGIDPKVKKEIEIEGLKIVKGTFNYGQDVKTIDLIVGLEPCDATIHIARCDKPCAVSLCFAAHDGFNSIDEWYNYLLRSGSGSLFLEDIKILGKQHKIMKRK